MFHIIYPPDPDCPKCHGSGVIANCDHKGNRWPGMPEGMTDSCLFGRCDCAAPGNQLKIQQRYDHEFVCKKCGKVHGGDVGRISGTVNCMPDIVV